MSDLRNRWFETLEALKDRDDPMPIDRAKAISDVSQTIFNSAKVELQGTVRSRGPGTVLRSPPLPQLGRAAQALFLSEWYCVANMATLEVRWNMRQVSLREFRTRGSKALKVVPEGETILLAGQDGPAYFLVPVVGDVIIEDRELRRAMAKASLRQNWRLVEASDVELSDEEIEREISHARQGPQRRKTK